MVGVGTREEWNLQPDRPAHEAHPRPLCRFAGSLAGRPRPLFSGSAELFGELERPTDSARPEPNWPRSPGEVRGAGRSRRAQLCRPMGAGAWSRPRSPRCVCGDSVCGDRRGHFNGKVKRKWLSSVFPSLIHLKQEKSTQGLTEKGKLRCSSFVPLTQEALGPSRADTRAELQARPPPRAEGRGALAVAWRGTGTGTGLRETSPSYLLHAERAEYVHVVAWAADEPATVGGG